jgi:hypothetical protein
MFQIAATQPLGATVPITAEPAIAQNPKFNYFSPKSRANAQWPTTLEPN